MNIVSRDSLLDFDRLFNHFSFPSVEREFESELFRPKVDIKELDNHFEITAELAGVKKDDLEVHLEDGVLSIKATVNTESTDEQDGKVIRRERHSGNYFRSFNVGKYITESDINAKFENGLLTIDVPKAQEAQPQKKLIDVK